MKKFISLALIAAMLVSLTACNNAQTSSTVASEDKSSSVEESASTTTESKEDSTVSADSDTADSVSESSDISDDKYEIKITDEKYGEKAYIVEGVKTVVKDGKTYTVGGDFDDGCIIDDVWLPDLRSDYPNAYDLLCFDSLFEFFDMYKYINLEKIVDEIPTSTEFYEQNGELWGPSEFDYYVGDIKNNEIGFCNDGISVIFEKAVDVIYEKKLNVWNDNDVDLITKDSKTGKWRNYILAEEKISIKKEPIVTVMKNDGYKKVEWKSNSKAWGNHTSSSWENADYGVIIGIYENHFLTFIPKKQCIIAYEYSEDYRPIVYAQSFVFK